MMSTGGKRKARSPRVAPLELSPNRFAQLFADIQRPDVTTRLAMCFVAIVVMWMLVRGWAPTFAYREGMIPTRDIDARIAFREKDPRATEEAQRRAVAQTPWVYEQDPAFLKTMRGSLETQVKQVLDAPGYKDLGSAAWRAFVPAETEKRHLTPEQEEDSFVKFRETLALPPAQRAYERALAKAFEPLEQNGVLEKLQHTEGNLQEIFVYPSGKPQAPYIVRVDNVLMGEVLNALKRTLDTEMPSPAVADPIYTWMKSQLLPTLKLNEEMSTAKQEAARVDVPDEYTHYRVGQVLAVAKQPLNKDSLQLLRLEHNAWQEARTFTNIFYRSLAVFSLIVAVSTLCGYYIVNYDRPLVEDLQRFATLLLVVMGTVAIARWAMSDQMHAELAPLVIFSLICGVTCSRELALLLSVSLATVLVTAGGHSLGEFLILVGTVVAAILLLGRIRSRTRLIAIGIYASLVAFVLSFAAGVLDSQPLNYAVAGRAFENAAWTVVAGFLMTGLLPFIEMRFGVLTELRLLEFGDVSHPLLQELVRRAPGTYNHSINVASIAEAAAESIGARGLLVRVGAYFHDIGKMLKPTYFVENQAPGVNRHENLNPAMSTLIIIAHIKDGADLARQHKLPQPIIDFIEQHHGTTLVEYFYRRASEQQEANPDSGHVEESAFRYPGPKPQSKEAAVLMLADAAESAGRALVEPTPARLEGLVEQLAMNRLLDGQFDECGLNLKELRQVQDSLIKSLTAVYHGRVKYPDQRTA